MSLAKLFCHVLLHIQEKQYKQTTHEVTARKSLTPRVRREAEILRYGAKYKWYHWLDLYQFIIFQSDNSDGELFLLAQMTHKKTQDSFMAQDFTHQQVRSTLKQIVGVEDFLIMPSQV